MSNVGMWFWLDFCKCYCGETKIWYNPEMAKIECRNCEMKWKVVLDTETESKGSTN